MRLDKPERILRANEVCQRIGCGKSKLYLMLGSGEFPGSIRVSNRIVGWRESDVDAWIKGLPLACPKGRERGLSVA